jgi:hypothetical protein
MFKVSSGDDRPFIRLRDDGAVLLKYNSAERCVVLPLGPLVGNAKSVACYGSCLGWPPAPLSCPPCPESIQLYIVNVIYFLIVAILDCSDFLTFLKLL